LAPKGAFGAPGSDRGRVRGELDSADCIGHPEFEVKWIRFGQQSLGPSNVIVFPSIGILINCIELAAHDRHDNRSQ
jgi:hypothetical protein